MVIVVDRDEIASPVIVAITNNSGANRPHPLFPNQLIQRFPFVFSKPLKLSPLNREFTVIIFQTGEDVLKPSIGH